MPPQPTLAYGSARGEVLERARVMRPEGRSCFAARLRAVFGDMPGPGPLAPQCVCVISGVVLCGVWCGVWCVVCGVVCGV